MEISLQAHEQKTKDGKHNHYFSCFSIPFRAHHQYSVIATCEELGIAVVAYSYAAPSLHYRLFLKLPNSPLGRGLLTGQIKSRHDFEEGDFRRGVSRFLDDVSFMFHACSRPFA